MFISSTAALSEAGPLVPPFIVLRVPSFNPLTTVLSRFDYLSGEAPVQLMKMGFVLIASLGEILFSYPAWAWFAEGHEVVAVIAADDLTPTARSRVVQNSRRVHRSAFSRKAMAASIRPDTEFRNEDRSSAQWHFIDICLQDKETDLPARCLQGNCVTAKIDEYASSGSASVWVSGRASRVGL